MYVYICVCVCICMCMCTYMYVCVCVFACNMEASHLIPCDLLIIRLLMPDILVYITSLYN